MAVPHADTTLWTIRTADGRSVECVARFAMGGVQVEILSDGWPTISRVFATGTEATAWAEEEHEAWTTAGAE